MSPASTIDLALTSVDRALELAGSPLVEPVLHPAVAQQLRTAARHLPNETKLRIRLAVPTADLARTAEVQAAVAAHFAREEAEAWDERRRILRNGRSAALLGVLVVGVLLGLGQAVAKLSEAGLARAISESLTVFAWVAMWRPAELLLYDHRPVRAQARLAQRLAGAVVELIASEPPLASR